MATSMPRPTALPWTAVWSLVTLGHPVNINGTWKIKKKQFWPIFEQKLAPAFNDSKLDINWNGKPGHWISQHLRYVFHADHAVQIFQGISKAARFGQAAMYPILIPANLPADGSVGCRGRDWERSWSSLGAETNQRADMGYEKIDHDRPGRQGKQGKKAGLSGQRKETRYLICRVYKQYIHNVSLLYISLLYWKIL